MAHVEKMKAGAVAPMLRHYERSMDATLERDNVDRERTHLNYEIGDGDVRERINECVEAHNAAGKALRSDAVVMADWVITKPQDVPEGRTREFFERVHEFLQERYGRENCPRAFIHMDETTPHMHAPVIPFDERAQRFQASKLINRADLQSFHGDLSRHIERTMGQRYSVELTEEQRQERGIKYTDMGEYQAARDRLESVRRAGEKAERERDRLRKELERAKQEAPRGLLAIEEQRARESCERARERYEEARVRNEEARGRVEQLRGRVEQVRREIDERLQPLREKAQGLKARLEAVKAEIRRLSRENGIELSRSGRPKPERSHSQDVPQPKRGVDMPTPGRDIGMARGAADAMHWEVGHDLDRGWDLSR